ncbi:hypothetical protein HDU76_006225 [Blyttiomyces sp. JEL0837]|nr:hypothetical protein HDU76_006225 [Blyttiomyces sp. JEL0837]
MQKRDRFPTTASVGHSIIMPTKKASPSIIEDDKGNKVDLESLPTLSCTTHSKEFRSKCKSIYAAIHQFFAVELAPPRANGKCRGCEGVMEPGTVRFRHLVCGNKCFKTKGGYKRFFKDNKVDEEEEEEDAEESDDKGKGKRKRKSTKADVNKSKKVKKEDEVHDVCGRWHPACLLEAERRYPSWFLHSNPDYVNITSGKMLAGFTKLSADDQKEVGELFSSVKKE